MSDAKNAIDWYCANGEVIHIEDEWLIEIITAALTPEPDDPWDTRDLGCSEDHVVAVCDPDIDEMTQAMQEGKV